MKKKVEKILLSITSCVLTIAIIIQIKTVTYNGTTISTNKTESSLKTQVLKMKEKYENEYAELERKEGELEKVRKIVSSNDEELINMENTIKKYNILVGNTDVTGPGVIITLTDGDPEFNTLKPSDVLIHAENVIAVINELKNAGAEAISVNGERIVNSTAIPCDGNVIMINGTKKTSPIQIMAIGPVEVMSTLNRAGGTLEEFMRQGKKIDFKRSQNIEIPKYTGVINFKYAHGVN